MAVATHNARTTHPHHADHNLRAAVRKRGTMTEEGRAGTAPTKEATVDARPWATATARRNPKTAEPDAADRFALPQTRAGKHYHRSFSVY